jgi:1,4-dihydroxy-2-naphthoyl-CoA hydrolase
VSPFSYERVIRFADTDAAGVVYFPRLLSLCHEAYEASLAAAGLDLAHFFGDARRAIPITHVEADFRRPLRVGDRSWVELSAVRESETAFSLHYRIRLGEGVAATATTRHVCIDPIARTRMPLPAEILDWLTTVELPV